ncbi:MAG: hypothetical protein M3Y35_11425 [Actinomycetota bacterium]|nr:hypothetical protein [Actinomycetota bacterium]
MSSSTDSLTANWTYRDHTEHGQDRPTHFGGAVEPLSGVPDYPLRCIADARRVISLLQARGVWNVKLLADLYHLSANGEDVAA